MDGGLGAGGGSDGSLAKHAVHVRQAATQPSISVALVMNTCQLFIALRQLETRHAPGWSAGESGLVQLPST